MASRSPSVVDIPTNRVLVRQVRYLRENPGERMYRDLRVDRIWEGTSEIQRLIVANEVAKRGLDGVLSHGAVPRLAVDPAGG